MGRPLGRVENELMERARRVPSGSWVPAVQLPGDLAIRQGTAWLRAARSLERRGMVDAAVLECADGRRRMCVRIADQTAV